jgi:predicted thioredoxin/glutaredoxin
VNLELITRARCGLCDELHQALRAELARRGLELPVAVVDVDSDPELVRRFGWHVPVLRLGGEVLCAHRLDAERLDAALAGRRWEPLELG